MGHSVKRYTIRDWWRDHRGQQWLRVSIDRPPFPPRPRMRGRLPELWYYIRCRFWYRYHVITIRDLPPTWMDADTRLLHAAFQTLGDVIEKEHIFDRNSPEGDPSDGKSWAWALGEMQTLWTWWTVERPAREKRFDAAVDAWSASRNRDIAAHEAAHGTSWRQLVGGIYRWNPDADFESDETKHAWTYLRSMDEEVRDAEDDAMLHRLVAIRLYLWT
jgi:hypothetical protein